MKRNTVNELEHELSLRIKHLNHLTLAPPAQQLESRPLINPPIVALALVTTVLHLLRR